MVVNVCAGVCVFGAHVYLCVSSKCLTLYGVLGTLVYMCTFGRSYFLSVSMYVLL